MKKKKPWPVFIGQGLALLGLLYGLGWWFTSHYVIVISRGKPCLPGRIYLVAYQLRNFVRGDLILKEAPLFFHSPAGHPRIADQHALQYGRIPGFRSHVLVGNRSHLER